MSTDILKRIRGTTYYEVITKNPASLSNRHILLAQMHAVRLNALHESHMIINDERSPRLPAHTLCLKRNRQYLLFRCILHAKLNPTATALQCQTDGVEVRIAVVIMTDELYHPPQAALMIITLTPSLIAVVAHSERGII